MTFPNKHSEFQHLGKPEPALIHGRLVDVDPESGTAVLSAYMYIESRIPLRFDASLEMEVLKLERKFVKVKGHGWFDEQDQWIVVVVEGIDFPEDKPFDRDEFLNDPSPKIFDPNNVPPMVMSEEEWEAFDRALRESRGRREL